MARDTTALCCSPPLCIALDYSRPIGTTCFIFYEALQLIQVPSHHEEVDLGLR